MHQDLTRRGFIVQGLAGAAAIGVLGQGVRAEEEKPSGKLRKALQFGMVQGGKSVEDKFKIAQDCGWEGFEIGAGDDQKFIDDLRAASDKMGMPVHSVVCQSHWGCPLSDPDPEVVKKGIEGMKLSLRNARDVKADAVLLVPAVVTDKVRYKDAYERSQARIRELIPMAEEYKVAIAVENVWNKFLLSPMEFAKYVDEFNSKFVRAYFDCGNVVIFGYPQDWIRTLGSRLAKIHLKDFKRDGFQWKAIREGDVQWPEVRKAFADAGYNGWLTPEVGGGNEAYLRDLSARVDKIIAGQ